MFQFNKVILSCTFLQPVMLASGAKLQEAA